MLALASGIAVNARPLKIRVKTPGSLAELVGEEKKYTTREMVLEGALNGDDLRFLREMAGSDSRLHPTSGQLRTLDLRKVSFAQGGGVYVEREGRHSVTGGAHTLPAYLFSHCPLVQVDLPVRLDTIATGALEETKLRRIELPEGVCVMAWAFSQTPELEEIVFPKHVRKLFDYALEQAGVRRVVLNNVDCIGGCVFSKMPAVETVEVNGYVGEMYGWKTFFACPRLKSVDFRGVVLRTGYRSGPRMLVDCPVLERVTFHDAIYAIALGPAEECPAFRGYEIKGTVLNSYNPDFIRPLDDAAEGGFSPARRAALERTLPALQHILRNGTGMYPLTFYTTYAVASRYAREGDRKRALAWLGTAVASGWYDYADLRDNEVWNGLQGNAHFKALLEQVHKNCDFISVLKQSAPYAPNTREYPAFAYQAPTDSNLVRVREYFKLDSIAGSGDDLSRIKNIMYWLHDAIRHDGPSSWPSCDCNAIDLYELCRREGRGLNCRGLALILNELYLACGIPSRVLSCMPKASDVDTECHVINVAWSRSLNKWVWMDPSFAAFVSDENGLLLHPGEVRERLRQDQPLVLNEDANWNHETEQTVDYYLKEYMAKNLYWFNTHLRNEYQMEGKNGTHPPTIRLTPKGTGVGTSQTNDDAYFWQAP